MNFNDEEEAANGEELAMMRLHKAVANRMIVRGLSKHYKPEAYVDEDNKVNAEPKKIYPNSDKYAGVVGVDAENNIKVK